MKKSVREFLEDKHSMYGDFNQSERSDCRKMAELGHPKAASYVRLRHLFDGLKYAANSSSRYFSCKDTKNFSEVWAPKLAISWKNSMDIEGCFYHEIYPSMGEVWDKYVEANAKQGWKKASPSLIIGCVVISTTNESMADAIAGTAIGKAARASSVSDDEGTYRYQLFPTGVSQFYELLRVIKEFHKGYVLPKRTLVDDESDKAPWPMHRKKVTLANVDRPSVESRSVMIPLLPLNEHCNRVALENSEFLAQCLNQGLAWGEADAHLQAMLSTPAYHSLQQRFATSQ